MTTSTMYLDSKAGAGQTIRRTVQWFALVLLVALSLPALPAAGQATVTVNTTADNTISGNGNCTLREAITNANSNSDTTSGDCDAGVDGTDRISFDIPGTDPGCSGGVCTIQPTSALPAITEAVEIDGYTQPGASANTLAVGNDAVLLIELDGTNAGAGAEGLTITGPGSTIKGLVINRFSGNGVEVSRAGAMGNAIEGNFIGTDSNGTDDLGNTQNGVHILFGASDNTIGGTAPAKRNVISGNSGFGVWLHSTTGNVVAGNYIGTDATGTADLGNSLSGVRISLGASTNIIGGTTAEARNVIAFNGTHGVEIVNNGTTDNQVQGNYIGTDATGTADLGNTQNGVRISSEAASNTIGGTATGAANTVAFNGQDGVVIRNSAGTGNAIARNSLFSNGDLGINLGNDGVTANDANDPDLGPNNLQNFPTLSAGIDGAGDLVVTYRVDTDETNASYPLSVEFFLADADTSEGKTFLDSNSYTSGDHSDCGTAPCTKTLNLGGSTGVSLGDFLVATATDNQGNTSEFSASVKVYTLGTLFVNTTADNTTAGDGTCTLREAITNANDNIDGTSGDCAAGVDATDTIAFNINGGGSLATIQPTGSFLTILEGVTIDGTTQGCAGGGPCIELDGTNSVGVGLLLRGSNSMIKGLVINRFGVGVTLVGATATGNTIASNYIGTDVTGTIDRGNTQRGVYLFSGAANNIIGGTAPGAGNVISGNDGEGIRIGGGGGNVVQGNYIGTDVTGAFDLGNTLGVNILSNNNIIGGTASGAGNTVAFNGQDGVVLAAGTGNTIEGNSLFSNGELGIDLSGDGVTPNDPGDGDTGANNLQNFPTFSAFIDGAGDLVVTYRVDTDEANAAYPLSVEFFEADDDNEEGKTFLGSDSYTTGDHPGTKTVNLGNATTQGVSLGDKLVATATDDLGNTSEFSASVTQVVRGITVNTTADDTTAGDGTCTLREAITNANSNSDTTSGDCGVGDPILADRIVFDISGGGVKTIQPTSALPAITEAVEINGYTQPGASPNTLAVGNNAVLLIELDGTNAGGSVYGLRIEGPRSTIKGLVINRFGGHGVQIYGTHHNTIEGNYIGTDVTGTADLGNSKDGVYIDNSENNIIGGTDPGAGNTVAFNGQDGVAHGSNGRYGNAFLGNSLFSNGELGIDLGFNGVTANDAGDPDTGPNKLQNFPSFSEVTVNADGDLVVTYHVDSNPTHAAYPLRVEFFEADADDEEGKTFLISDSYTSGDHSGCGTAPCEKTVNLGNAAGLGVSPGDKLVATATDADGNTSEFSVAKATVVPGVDLAVSVSESVDPVVTGSGTGNLVYTITVTNHGATEATGVALSNTLTLPSGVTLESITPSSGTFTDPTWMLGNLASGASETLTVVLTVDASAAAGTDVIANAASVTAVDQADSDPSNDTADEATSILPSGPATRYVATTGSDTANTCLVQASPCATLTHAVDQANAGDTIFLDAGTYTENGLIIDKAVMIEGPGALVR